MNVGLAFQTRDDIIDSDQDSSEERQIRPNSVSLFGLDASRSRLENYVLMANRALDKFSLKSEELRFLANKLSEI